MNFRIRLLATAASLIASCAIAAGSFNSNHPEEAYPDNMPRLTSPGPYDDYIKQVQQKLHELGFDAGPINGDFGTKTQTALGQFQLSRAIPASGMLDDETLAELGVQRQTQEPARDEGAAQSAEASATPSSAAGGSASGNSARAD